MTSNFHHVLRRPIVTEKSTNLKEVHHQFVFEVAKSATKHHIKAAVEQAFRVNVVNVRTVLCRGKLKRVGKYQGRRAAWKKAFVTLAQGQKIDVFEGV